MPKTLILPKISSVPVQNFFSKSRIVESFLKNFSFGAKVTSNSTGVLWNDEMNDFSLPGLSDYYGFAPTPANYIQPGKRPMSATSPIVVFNPSGNVEDVNVSKNSSKRIH